MIIQITMYRIQVLVPALPDLLCVELPPKALKNLYALIEFSWLSNLSPLLLGLGLGLGLVPVPVKNIKRLVL
jgi:hypothetical protein